MTASIGVNLRVTGHCRQGGRKYMEDYFSVAYQQTEDEKDLEYAFFGIYDGHGGAEAAIFAKEHLMETIIKQKDFWSENDEDVIQAIRDGYIATHYAMWKDQAKWPKTASGLPSTAGTTASVAFIRRGKIYIGHVGDSGIILGYQEPGSSEWKARPLTRDHKPENAEEMSRIESCGGKVIVKSGVPRVVWNRPRIGHQGPVRRSTPIDEIPFLAVARSLGDLWSYNSQLNQFVVSPDPDCSVIRIDTNTHRCLIFGTDGLYNMLSPQLAVHIVQQAERHNEQAALSSSAGYNKPWLNPSKLLVERALEQWHMTKTRADNTSVVTLMLDPSGPPRAQVLKDRKKQAAFPDRGLKIMTRYEDANQEGPSDISSENVVHTTNNTENENIDNVAHCSTSGMSKENPEHNNTCLSDNTPVASSEITSNSNFPLKERNFVPKPRESTSFDPREGRPSLDNNKDKENLSSNSVEDDSIQINEISSSSLDVDNFDEENNPGHSNQHNLRSSMKKTVLGENKNETGAKRKQNFDDNRSPRKSLRIDHNQKKVEKEQVKPRNVVKRASLLSMNSPKMSLTQKILKSKKLSLKKKDLLKKKLTKAKLKMVLASVKQKSKVQSKLKKKIVKKTNAKVVKDELAAKKVVTGKIISSNFKRCSQRNMSIRAGKVISTPSKTKLPDKKGTNKEVKAKVVSTRETRSMEKATSPLRLTEREMRSSINAASNSAAISLPNKASTSKSLPVNVKQLPKTSEKAAGGILKSNTLRKRLQQKTASLRKNVINKRK